MTAKQRTFKKKAKQAAHHCSIQVHKHPNRKFTACIKQWWQKH